MHTYSLLISSDQCITAVQSSLNPPAMDLIYALSIMNVLCINAYAYFFSFSLSFSLSLSLSLSFLSHSFACPGRKVFFAQVNFCLLFALLQALRTWSAFEPHE